MCFFWVVSSWVTNPILQLLGFKITGEVAASPDETKAHELDPRLDTSAVEGGLDITVFIDWQAAGSFRYTAEGMVREFLYPSFGLRPWLDAWILAPTPLGRST